MDLLGLFLLLLLSPPLALAVEDFTRSSLTLVRASKVE